jgi:hypothetical protein
LFETGLFGGYIDVFNAKNVNIGSWLNSWIEQKDIISQDRYGLLLIDATKEIFFLPCSRVGGDWNSGFGGKTMLWVGHTQLYSNFKSHLFAHTG